MPNPIPWSKPPNKHTQNGFQTATFYSGGVAPGLTAAPGAVSVGSDTLLVSGAGRLDSVLLHQHTAQSGQLLPIVFYDAGAPVSGGPLYASGHKLVGFVPAYNNPVSGAVLSSGNLNPPLPQFGVPIIFSMPFQSGLCFNSASGQAGFTVVWTPEPAQQ